VVVVGRVVKGGGALVVGMVLVVVEGGVSVEELMAVAKCSILPFEKGMTPVLSATPWITDSTTVQNIVIIANSVIYYIANPDTQVFKTLQSCLATWTSLNNRV
jgi:hypothetical protein